MMGVGEEILSLRFLIKVSRFGSLVMSTLFLEECLRSKAKRML